MKKYKIRFLAAVLSGALILGAAPSAAFGATDTKGHWAEAVIKKWTNAGYISGYPDGSFRPNASITRAEFTVLANKAFSYRGSAGISFQDVPLNYWGRGSIATAVAAGYVRGDGNGKFRPNDTVQRQEAAVMLAQIKNLAQNSAYGTRYNDSWQIPSWSKGYIGAVSVNGIMSGFPDGSFQPEKPITRAEAVAALDRALILGSGSEDTKKEGETEDYTLKDTSLRNKTITGDLIIPSSMGSKSISLYRVTVEGRLLLEGGSTVIAEGCDIEKLVMDKYNVTFKSEDKTKVKEVEFLENGKITGSGYDLVGIEDSSVNTVSIDAVVDSVYLNCDSDVRLMSDADITEFEATSKAKNRTVNIARGAEVSKLILREKMKITGSGDIKTLTVYEDGVTSSIRPDTLKTMDGAKRPSYSDSSSSSDSDSSSSSSYDNLTISDKDNKSFDGNGRRYNNVRIKVSGAHVEDMTVYGNLTIGSEVGNGTVTLENIEVRGDVYVYGGGENSVVFDNCDLKGDIISDASNKDVSSRYKDDPVALKFYSDTSLKGSVIVRGNTIIEPYSSGNSITLKKVVVDRALNGSLEVRTNVESLVLQKYADVEMGNNARISDYRVESGADGSTLSMSNGCIVTSLVSYGTLKVEGSGYIQKIAKYKEVTVSGVTVGETESHIPVPVSGIGITGKDSVKKGESIALSAVVSPSDASNKAVTWQSSNEAVASVDQNGKVTGKGGGTVTITAVSSENKDKKATHSVTVLDTDKLKAAVEAARKKMDVIVIGEPSTIQIGMDCWLPADAAIFADAIKAADDIEKAPESQEKIDAAFAAFEEAARIFQEAKTTGTRVAVTGIAVTPESKELFVLDEATLSVEVSPADATNKDVIWNSSEPTVVTVTSDGKIRGLTEGTAVISAETADGGMTAFCNVTVKVKPLDKSGLEAAIEQANGALTGKQFIADVSGVATVESGKDCWLQADADTLRSAITAAVETSNTAKIQAELDTAAQTLKTAVDLFNSQKKTGTKIVRVTGVAISGAGKVVVGGTITLTASITPQNATNQSVVWVNSDNSGIFAAVTPNGSSCTVVGKKAGTFTVTAEADGVISAPFTITVQ